MRKYILEQIHIYTHTHTYIIALLCDSGVGTLHTTFIICCPSVKILVNGVFKWVIMKKEIQRIPLLLWACCYWQHCLSNVSPQQLMTVSSIFQNQLHCTLSMAPERTKLHPPPEAEFQTHKLPHPSSWWSTNSSQVVSLFKRLKFQPCWSSSLSFQVW